MSEKLERQLDRASQIASGDEGSEARADGAIDVPAELLEAVDAPGSEEPRIITDGSGPPIDDPELDAIESLAGEVFDERYQINDELARGGMGIVFRAEHLALNRPVVIKVLKAAQVQSPTAKARFEREARRACQLDHPNIVTVHDFGYHDGLGYLVMEFVDGITLYDYLKRHGPMMFQQFAPIASAVLAGLAEAHSQGIVHRDIKASNIMLQFQDRRLRRVKILDFGLAKVEGAEEDDVTKKSNLIGTMGAMPPERILCKPTDCRVDLYAFGVCAYRMIVGRRPFVGEDMHVLYQHVHEHPAPLTDLLAAGHEYPLMVLEWVHRLLAKDPDERPRDAEQARQWLHETITDTSVFRIDEGEAAWLEDASNGQPAYVSSTFEVTSPSWSVPSSPGGSYRSLLSGGGATAAALARYNEEHETESSRPSQSPVALAIVLGVAAIIAIAGVAGVAIFGPDGESAEVIKADRDASALPPSPPVRNDQDLSEVFAQIESDLERGAYGNAENLLLSIRDRIQGNTEHQVRAAEFQTRIDIDKNLRKARQAEAAMRIEEAVDLYDAVLSLDAGNEIAKKRHEHLSSHVLLKLTSDPNGIVFLDGERLGTTPLEKLIPATFSKVDVRADGYQTWSATLVPDGGTRVELAARPQRERRRANRPNSGRSTAQNNDAAPKSGHGIRNEDLMKME